MKKSAETDLESSKAQISFQKILFEKFPETKFRPK
jgi:hypothetical protein